MMNYQSLAAVALLLAHGTVARAESAAMDTIVVTATGRAQTIETVVAAVEVIDREALDAFAGSSVADVLRFASGAQAFSSGSTDRIGLRGFSANQTLVLVDGRRRPTRFAGQNLAAIPTEDIERIEIIRGPKSALYGADAMGGVINLILRRPTGPNELDARSLVGAATNGGRETFQLALGWGTVSEQASHRLSAEHRRREPLQTDANGAEVYNRQRLLALAWRGDWQLADAHRLRWTLEFQDQDDDGKRFQPGRGPMPSVLYQSLEQDRRWLAMAGIDGELGGEWLYDFSLSRGETDGAARRQPDLIETTDYRIDEIDLRVFRSLGQHELTLGAGILREDVDISINDERLKRDSRYLLIQDQWQLGGDISVLLGLRYDDYSDFGNTTNPRAGILWRPGDWSLRANWGRAFRAPDSIEQFSSFVRGTSLITGNPDLGPERTHSLELGASRRLGQAEISIDAFDNRVDDLINTVLTGQTQGPLNILTRENVARARLRGLETRYSQRLGDHWSLRLGYDYLDARDRADDSRLLGRARHRAYADLGYGTESWRLNLRAQRLLDYYNRASPASAPFDENYARLDIYGEYRLGLNWALFAGIDNLTDRPDPQAAALQVTSDPGRRYYYLGLRFQRRDT